MNTGNEKILIIEDAPTQRAILSNLVTELGLIPICPSHFDSSIVNTIEKNSIKLVLLDLILLDDDGHSIGDGFQICSEIKSFDMSIKVIVISAEGDQAAQDFAMSQGADGFIHKPFKIEDLENCIQSLGLSTIKTAN